MKRYLTLAVVVAMVAAFATPASAVLYGTPDGDDHPYVGIMVAMDENKTPMWRCSGTLISPKVFLTAGHCVYGAAHAMVWFDSGRPEGYPTSGGSLGTPIPHPAYDDFATFPGTSDVGVVKFKRGVTMSTYGSVAAENALSALWKHTIFDIVGYGLQDVQPVEVRNIQRIQAEAMLINSTSGYSGGFNLQLSSNSGKNAGGLCFGDSGGPVLLGSTVYAVNSFVLNGNCAGSGFSHRVDLPAIRDWILSQ